MREGGPDTTVSQRIPQQRDHGDSSQSARVRWSGGIIWERTAIAPAVRLEDGSNLTEFSAGIFKQSMGARNRVGIRLSYRPARLHSLDELVSWNRFLGSLKV
jgi:hypothetical protein